MLGAVNRDSFPVTIEAVRLRLNSVFIHKVREPGKGEIRVISVVTDGISEQPIQLFAQTFEKVRRKTALNLGTGVTLYRTESKDKIPAYLDYQILVMELDDDVRAVGTMLDEVRNDKQFKDFEKALLATTSATAPQVALITAAADLALNLIAKILKANKDDQLFLLRGSFDNAFDDLGTGFGPLTQENRNVTITYQVEAKKVKAANDNGAAVAAVDGNQE
ncbi:hypothetical protein B0919_13705 [Hymenobacter sp. CRA2]|nr:hypothetical protein B0919_13705 [Hymenobacter sp. CRA2]